MNTRIRTQNIAGTLIVTLGQCHKHFPPWKPTATSFRQAGHMCTNISVHSHRTCMRTFGRHMTSSIARPAGFGGHPSVSADHNCTSDIAAESMWRFRITQRRAQAQRVVLSPDVRMRGISCLNGRSAAQKRNARRRPGESWRQMLMTVCFERGVFMLMMLSATAPSASADCIACVRKLPAGLHPVSAFLRVPRPCEWQVSFSVLPDLRQYRPDQASVTSGS